MLVSKKELANQRDLIVVKSPEKIVPLLNEHFLNTAIFIKGHEPPVEVKIVEIRKPNHVVLNFMGYEPSLNETYILYKILNRYCHISARVVQEKVHGGRYHLLTLDHIAIAKKKRDSKRIAVIDDAIFISNFRVNRSEMNINSNRIPTSIKLGLSELKNIYHERADYIDVQHYDKLASSNKKNPIFDKICISAKPLLLKNTLDSASYKPFNSAYFDYATYLGTKINQKITEYRQKGILSEICIPVVYAIQDQTSVPLGYVHMQSKAKYFSQHDVKDVWQGIKSVMKRIRDSNTMIINEREKIVNISYGGMLLFIQNKDLIEKIEKQTNLIFDLFFRMQAPITLSGLIRKFEKGDKGVHLGIEIEGNSSRPNEMERFHENLDKLEKAQGGGKTGN